MRNDGKPEIDLDHFCFYPFMQLLLQPTGVVSPCCWNQGITLGKIPEQGLLEIWNGEPARALRREFLEGKPVSCAQQMKHIGCHRFSRRDGSSQIELVEIQPRAPRRFDLRLNGRCNLECVMCEVWTQPNGLYDETDFWRLGPTEIFPNLLEMDVLGGEPFVQSDTYRLIDQVTAVNSSCSFAFVTNGHYKFNDRIRKYLDKIPIRWLQVSVDSVDPANYPKVRRGGRLERVLETIDGLVEYAARRKAEGRGFRILASMCVQSQNWHEVPAFLDFLQGKPSIEPVLQFAYSPAEVSLLGMTAERRGEIASTLRLGTAHHPSSVTDPVLLPLADSLISAGA